MIEKSETNIPFSEVNKYLIRKIKEHIFIPKSLLTNIKSTLINKQNAKQK